MNARPRSVLATLLALLLALPLLTGFAPAPVEPAAAGFRAPGLLPGNRPDEGVVTAADLARLRSQPPPPEITARAAVVWDTGSNTELFAKAPDERLVPASTTKMLTALLVIAHAPLAQPVTIEQRDFGPDDESRMCNQAYTICLAAGDTVTMEDLLYGMLMVSGGDAARAAARTVGTTLLAGAPGDPLARFMQEMNGWVARHRLANTHFLNPDGYEVEGHYSSARDLRYIAGELLKQPALARIVGTQQTTRQTAQGKAIPLTNSNQLLGQRPGLHGVKTGTAGDDLQWECLIAAQWGPGGQIVTVVLGSAKGARYTDTAALLDWTNAAFRWLPLGRDAEPPGLKTGLARWGLGFREARTVVLPAWEAPLLRYRLLLNPAGAGANDARGEVVFLVWTREILRLPVYALDPAAPGPATPGRP